MQPKNDAHTVRVQMRGEGEEEEEKRHKHQYTNECKSTPIQPKKTTSWRRSGTNSCATTRSSCGSSRRSTRRSGDSRPRANPRRNRRHQPKPSRPPRSNDGTHSQLKASREQENQVVDEFPRLEGHWLRVRDRQHLGRTGSTLRMNLLLRRNSNCPSSTWSSMPSARQKRTRFSPTLARRNTRRRSFSSRATRWF